MLVLFLFCLSVLLPPPHVDAFFPQSLSPPLTLTLTLPPLYHTDIPSSLSHSHSLVSLSPTLSFTVQDRNAPSLGRFARSLSPPAPSKRSSNWKATADEDATYRTEVLHSQIPTEGDEWMAHEMRVLKEFTRIFPPEKKIPESEEMEGDDENDGKIILMLIILLPWPLI